MTTAAAAQRDWAAATAGERAAVLRRVAAITEERRDEIVDWLVHEGGGTVAKSHLEWAAVCNGLHEAAGMPHHVEGRIMPSDVPGKESRVYRAACRRGRGDQPVELPAAPELPLRRPRPRRRQCRRPQAGVATRRSPAGSSSAKIFEEAGLPPGVLSVIVGSGQRDRRRQFVEHPVPRFISFTGSTPVGRHDRRARRPRPDAQARGARARRERTDGGARRRRPRPRRRCRRLRLVLPPGPDLHDTNRLIVDSIGPRRVRRPLRAPGRGAAGRRPGRPRHGPRARSSTPSSASGIRDKASQARAAGSPSSFSAASRSVRRSSSSRPTCSLARRTTIADRPGGAVRSGRHHHPGRATRPRRWRSPTTPSTACRARSSPATSSGALRFARRIDAGMTHVNDSPVERRPEHRLRRREGQRTSAASTGEWAIDEFTTDHWISVQHEPRRYPM